MTTDQRTANTHYTVARPPMVVPIPTMSASEIPIEVE
jgi:hypothetical protein